MVTRNPECAPTESAKPETNRRFIADHSLNNATTLLIVIANTHFIVGTECPESIKAKLSPAAKLLMRLISEANDGAPVCPIKPALLLSANDKVQYVFEGTETRWFKKEIFITSQESLQGKGVRSTYRPVEKEAYMCGLRVKYTFTFTAGGEMAAIFITVSGLSSEELSPELCPDGILLREVEGLSVGAATDPTNKQVGYVCLVRSGTPHSPPTCPRHSRSWRTFRTT